MDFLQMEGKHVLVTGGASGIGRQTAVTLSEYGAKISVIDMNEDRLKETLSMLKGEGHTCHTADLTRIDDIEPMIKSIVNEAGAFDGYVQCAGISKDLPIKIFNFERLNQLMLINFYSFFEIVRVLSKKGRFNEGMSIVGISSTASECGVSSNTAYSASKAAMNGAMRSMAKELSSKGIRVNTILPGPTNTEMYRGFLSMKAEMSGAASAAPAPSSRNYLGINEPVDVANAIAFLLSPASKMITGIELPVDAGYTSC